MRRVGAWCAAHAYLLLSALLLAGLVVQTLSERWSGDVYEHLAVVRELTARPFDPTHPLLPVDAPHPLYSPYTVGLGLLASITGLGAVTTLKIAGIANAVFLLVAYRRFARVVTGQRYAEFFGLLAVLLVWGPTAWRLSGFSNLGSIGYGLPYPSTFATALMLVTLAEFDLVVRNGARAARLVTISIGVAVVLLTHPITGIATVAGLAAIWIGRGRTIPGRDDVVLLASLAVSVVLVSLWPYYSFWRLLVDNSDYTDAHFQLYESLPLRLAPLVIVVGLLVWLRPKLRSEPLLVWASCGASLYLLGLLTGQYVLGRVLAFTALAVLTKVGAVTAAAVVGGHGHDRERIVAWSAAALAVVGLVAASPALLRMVPSAVLPPNWRDDARLRSVTADYDILADMPADAVVAAWPNDTADVVPAFAGKVVATPKPVPFVDDAPAREATARRIFTGSTPPAERQRLVDDEGVEFLVFDPAVIAPDLRDELAELGRVVHSGEIVVVDLRR